MSEFVTFGLKGEYVDVVDEQDQPTGEVVDTGLAHANGRRHRDVHVWVTNGQDLLQQQRGTKTKIMPGEWDISVGGHVNAGETYLQAGQRETGEELGLWLPNERFRPIGKLATHVTYPGWQHPHNIIGEHFVVVQKDLQIADLQPEQGGVLDLRWYPIDQLEVDISSPETAIIHASHPVELYQLGIEGMRRAVARSS